MPVDVANERSLHTGRIPRIGGIAMTISVALSIALSIIALPNTTLPVEPLAIAVGLFFLSAIDDWFSLPVLPRLVGHLVATGLVVHSLHLPIILGLPAVLWLVWMTNLYNFMDGADGLAGGMTVIGFGAYALVAWPEHPGITWISLSVAGGSLGFLAFNFPPARIFLGDAGSIPLGFLAGAIGLVGWHDGVWPLWFPLIVFSPFVADATVTLVRRAWERKPIWQAHREHHYQQLILSNWSHRTLALVAWGAMVMIAASALLLLELSAPLQWFGIVVLFAVYGRLFRSINQRWRRTTVDQRTLHAAPPK